MTTVNAIMANVSRYNNPDAPTTGPTIPAPSEPVSGNKPNLNAMPSANPAYHPSFGKSPLQALYKDAPYAVKKEFAKVAKSVREKGYSIRLARSADGLIVNIGLVSSRKQDLSIAFKNAKSLKNMLDRGLTARLMDRVISKLAKAHVDNIMKLNGLSARHLGSSGNDTILHNVDVFPGEKVRSALRDYFFPKPL